jgi:putative PIN family toxin of toxin-antitoxin system
MPKVIIDTNILISGLLKQKSDPGLILSLIEQNIITLCLSEAIFTEYEEVLTRDKFKHLDQKKVQEFLLQLKKHAQWVRPRVSVDVIKNDQADNMFLECALTAKADFLVTGNTKHFTLQKFHQTQILAPKDFMRVIAKLLFEY